MKKKIIIAAIVLGIIGVIMVFSLYISEKQFRDWIDIHLLGKEITEQDLPIISLNTDKINQVHVYSKYIAVLSNKTIKLYNSFGEENASIEVDITTALFDSNDKYFGIAEEKGNKVYLILDKTYLWSQNVEGEIEQIRVNQNGYVLVVTSDSTHKSIVNVFNSEGKKLFNSYFSSTRIIDASISKDNKYIAIAELDTSGSIIQSNIKVISIQNAQNDPENAIVYIHNSESGKLIINLKYQNDGRLIALYDNSIEEIKDEKSRELLKIQNESISFMTIGLNGHYAFLTEEHQGLFNSKTEVKIKNINDNSENIIEIEDFSKEVFSKSNVLEINLGTEVQFYNSNGWIIKKYISNKEITNVSFSNELGAIIYKDKIIVIDF